MPDNQFYRNACMLLGSLKRGIVLKTPFVTFPMSKAGLQLAQILRNLGVIASFECIQKRHKLDTTCYPKWKPGQQEPSTTQELVRYPGMYLKLVMNCDKYKPHFTSKQAGPAEINQSYHEHLPLSVHVLSKPTKQQFVRASEMDSFKMRYGSGVLLLSTDSGLLLDVEAELMNKGGVALGFLGLPLSYVAQLRGILRAKQQQETAAAIRAGQPSTSARTPLTQWSIHSYLAALMEQRLSQQTSQAVQQRMEQLQATQRQNAEALRQTMKEKREAQEHLQLEQALLKHPDVVQDKLEQQRQRSEDDSQAAGSWILEHRSRDVAGAPVT